ncbi:MAG: sugar ABC transporter ATP-binding protein [Propionivibrio sp.]
MAARDSELLLSVDGLSKTYGGLKALSNAEIQVRYGEVHAVVGENGAGKSTFMKILGGIVDPDGGRIVFKDARVSFSKPAESIKAGIAIIHQELSVLAHLNIIENVYMGRMPTRLGKIQWKVLEEKTREVLALVGLDIDPYLTMDELSISQRQLVEIAKALSVDAQLVIMDEPNSSLSDTESQRLFEVIRSLQARSVSILYVSHKIEEVLRISDRITVFKDGCYVGTVDAARATVDSVIHMMVGRELTREYQPNPNQGAVLLRASSLCGKGFKNVSFDLHKGEILAFSGLVGAGRSETMRAIFGAQPISAGRLELEGRPVLFTNPDQAIKHGLAMVQEDRKRLSLFLELPIRFNISLAQLPRLGSRFKLDQAQINQLVAGFIKTLRVKTQSADDPVGSLSGGNQQKTVLARWLATKPRILILDEPTHGIDIGAKAEIYDLIRNLARQGMGIILISSELPEVMAMADRVVVMHEGSVTGILGRDRISEHEVMAYATGHEQNLH